MRVLIDHGGYNFANSGDLAMLTVASARVAAWGGSSDVRVITSEPDLVIPMGVTGQPVDLRGKELFTHRSSHAAALGAALGGVRPIPVVTNARTVLKHGPSGLSARCAFERHAETCDALVIAGGGYLNDHFPHHALSVLDLADWFLERGRPVGLFSQGLGPVRNRELRSTLRRVAAAATVVGLREPRFGQEILQELGVAGPHIRVTGDDAVELGLQEWTRNPSRGDRVGLNIRVVAYSGMDESTARGVMTGIASAAQSLGRPIQPTPISWQPADDDTGAIAECLELPRPVLDEVRSPMPSLGVIRLIARCSVVVTGSYHAAVFALSMGIPTLAVSTSEYYDTKFGGLIEQFGPDGIRVVRPDTVTPPSAATRILAEILDAAPGLAPALRARAEEQVARSQSLYQHMESVLFRPHEHPPAGPPERS
jgi:polysaccharide pyruvyl transferase WcaK-like protein